MMLMSVRTPLFINLLIISISIVIAIEGIKSWQENNDRIDRSNVLQAIEQLNSSIELLIYKLTECDESGCELGTDDLKELQDQLSVFFDVTAQEKKSISVVGVMEYFKIQSSISKYKTTNRVDLLLDELILIYMQIRKTADEISSLEQNKRIIDFELEFYRINIILIVVITSLLLTTLFYRFRINAISRKFKIENGVITELSNNISHLNDEIINDKINDISISEEERKIYSQIIAIHNDIELVKYDADLHRQLYALIGFEIRGVSNTINGGIEILFQNCDEEQLVMAKNIVTATHTLTELADNYNQLISQGVSKQNASFLSLISKLVVHMKSKLQDKSIELDCYIEDNMPNNIESDQTKLFWVLFLQISASLLSQTCQKVMMHIYTGSSEKIEGTTIFIDLFFIIEDLKLSDLSLDKFRPMEKKNETYNEWSKILLGSSSNFDSYTLIEERTALKRVQFDVIPINFMRSQSELKNYNILICGDSKLQTDLMEKLLTRFHCQVEIAVSANDVFKKLSVIYEFDAIILTDTTKGIQLKSFCKTLSSRLKKKAQTKLFLAISEVSVFKDISEHVDKVFYTPLLPHEFIPELVEALKDEESTDQEHNNILIVEDDKIQQLLLAKILKQQEFDSEVVSTGEDAIEYVKSNDIDIIFMDCIMPGMGGLEATKAIRETERINNNKKIITIIGATALTSENEHKACIDAGMDIVISKPYKNDEILNAIKKYSAIHKSA